MVEKMIFEVKDSVNEHKDPDPGVYYGTFQGIEQGVSKEEKPFLKWIFSAEDGGKYTAITDCDNPRTGNKLGRFLLGLKGSPEAGQVDASQYVGKKYALVYKMNKNGKSALDTISPCK